VLLIMVSVWAPVRWRHRRPWRALGFEPSTAPYNALWALRIALGLGSAFAVLALWARRHSSGIHNAASVPLPTTSHGQLGDFLAWYVIAAVLGPIAEEMVFRGFAYGLLFRKFGPAGAAVASAALWAAGHSMRLSYGSAFKTLFLVIVGIVYAEVYRRRQSLFPTVAFHIVGNSASVLIRDSVRRRVGWTVGVECRALPGCLPVARKGAGSSAHVDLKLPRRGKPRASST